MKKKFITNLGKVQAFGEPCRGWLLFGCLYAFSSTARKRLILDLNLSEYYE